MWAANEWQTYLATDTRIDSILFGCILAIWRNPNFDEFRTHRVWVMPLLVVKVGTWQHPGSTSTTLELGADELAMILSGIDLKSVRRRASYQQPVAV